MRRANAIGGVSVQDQSELEEVLKKIPTKVLEQVLKDSDLLIIFRDRNVKLAEAYLDIKLTKKEIDMIGNYFSQSGNLRRLLEQRVNDDEGKEEKKSTPTRRAKIIPQEKPKLSMPELFAKFEFDDEDSIKATWKFIAHGLAREVHVAKLSLVYEQTRSEINPDQKFEEAVEKVKESTRNMVRLLLGLEKANYRYVIGNKFTIRNDFLDLKNFHLHQNQIKKFQEAFEDLADFGEDLDVEGKAQEKAERARKAKELAELEPESDEKEREDKSPRTPRIHYSDDHSSAPEYDPVIDPVMQASSALSSSRPPLLPETIQYFRALFAAGVEIDSIIETGIDEKILTSLHEINYLRQMLGQNISASAESQSQPSASAPAPDAAAASVPAPDVEGASAAALDERDGRISRVGHRKG